MKIISHRGNIEQSYPQLENDPIYIQNAINQNIITEIDIWFVEKKYFLGHDSPKYEIDESWIIKNQNWLLAHCKNIQAFYNLSHISNNILKLCHSNDPYVAINGELIWVHDKNLPLNDSCIIPVYEKLYDISNFLIVHAICTDYVTYYKKLYEKSS